ncbi:hypothetical protein C4564_01110 [Candidatus Microgenomates bacterium]|nr:MAG: hypothetical protein C4564_01110 [Candidatus Microgenomates bacterium]
MARGYFFFPCFTFLVFLFTPNQCVKAKINPNIPANKKLFTITKKSTEKAEPNAILSLVGSTPKSFVCFFAFAAKKITSLYYYDLNINVSKEVFCYVYA